MEAAYDRMQPHKQLAYDRTSGGDAESTHTVPLTCYGTKRLKGAAWCAGLHVIVGACMLYSIQGFASLFANVSRPRRRQ
jgi:hypothetical protein